MANLDLFIAFSVLFDLAFLVVNFFQFLVLSELFDWLKFLTPYTSTKTNTIEKDKQK